MRVEDLVGSLQTYEHTLPLPKNIKSIALKNVRKEANNSSHEESMDEEDMAMFVRKFKSFLKHKKGNFSSTSYKSIEKPKGDSSGATVGIRIREKNPHGIQCHECGGYGHIRAKCANLKGNAFNATHSDESNKDDLKEGINYLAFVASCKSSHESSEYATPELHESSEGESEDDDLQAGYNNFFVWFTKLKKLNKKAFKKLNEIELVMPQTFN
jgi:hypothetical protein